MNDLDVLLDEVRQAQREALRHANLLPKVYAGVEAAVEARRIGRRNRVGWTIFATAGLAGAAAAALLVLRPAAPIAIAVGDARTPVASGALVEAPAAAPMPIHFSDGTDISLQPSARVAVTAVDAHGATLMLERGSLDVGVVHKRGAKWSVRAGGYEVAVTGTRFAVTFDPVSDALTVAMRTGSVLVRGPGLPAATPLHGGETLHADGRARSFNIATADIAHADAKAAVAAVAGTAAPAEVAGEAAAAGAEAVLGDEVAPAPAAPAEAPAPAETTAAAPAAPAPALRLLPQRAPHALDHRDRGWADLAQASRYRESLAVAERTGFSGLCTRLDAGSLVLLGDVARLAGNPGRAEEAYLAARRRFPRVDRPIFAMGLVAFEHRRRFHEAATWFTHYVESYPQGPLAREAAGRLIESWQRAGETDEARKAARGYLKKYPAGPHAALARQIAGS